MPLKFEELSGTTRTEKKHELRSKLYNSLRRRPGDSVTQFAANFRTLQAELKTEGVVVQDTDYAWIFQQRLGLSEIQRQLLETTVGEDPAYNEVEKEALRLFRRIHLKGTEAGIPRGLRAPSLSSGSARAPSTTSTSRRKPFLGSLRGGLPRLHGELIQLAALLHVETKADDSVAKIAKKVRPTAQWQCLGSLRKHLGAAA